MLKGVCGYQLQALMIGERWYRPTKPPLPGAMRGLNTTVNGFSVVVLALALVPKANAMLLHVRAILWNVTVQGPFTLRSRTYRKQQDECSDAEIDSSCRTCGRTWLYGRTGNRRTSRQFGRRL